MDCNFMEQHVEQYYFKPMGEIGHFSKNNLSIFVLGIQAPPGTAFSFNGMEPPIIIGSSGIYQLELQKGKYISSIESSDINRGQSIIIDTIQYAQK